MSLENETLLAFRGPRPGYPQPRRGPSWMPAALLKRCRRLYSPPCLATKSGEASGALICLAPEAPTSPTVRALLSSEVGTRAAEGHIGADKPLVRWHTAHRRDRSVVRRAAKEGVPRPLR